jgi:Flp pilus assembly pilin Flp
MMSVSVAARVTREERGVAMTEFALILPIFLVIVVGILAFGRVFFYWIETNQLASEAARWAAVDRNPYANDTPPQTLYQYVKNSATIEFQSDARVCIDFPDGGTLDIGDPVRVRVQKPFSFLPILNVGDITIRGSSTMRIERLAGNGAPTAYSAGAPYGACT